MVDAERFAAVLQLDLADRRHRGAVVTGLTGLGAVRAVAARAVSAGHQHGAHPLGGVARQYASRADRLVVGMGVHGHESQRGHRVRVGALSVIARQLPERPVSIAVRFAG